jgi:hypothetical protein
MHRCCKNQIKPTTIWGQKAWISTPLPLFFLSDEHDLFLDDLGSTWNSVKMFFQNNELLLSIILHTYEKNSDGTLALVVDIIHWYCVCPNYKY